MSARVLRTALPLLLASFLVADAAHARCLSQDPSTVQLVGTVTKRTLPGPPNYTSVGRGDRPEIVYFLDLDEAVCVSGSPGSRRNAKSHAGVEQIQLSNQASRAKTLVGKRVRVSGTLSTAQTDHDRTPVVLRVQELRVD
ncbi:MAG: DUF4431 domain-containing protein [Myxococcota bacterium]